MAIQAHTALREDALSRLSRAELQALGKAHEIKANLKSITIISQLLKKFPGGVPNPNPNQSAPARKKGRAKKGGVKKKKTQVKKEESVAPSVLSAKSEDEDSPIEQQNTASTSHDPPPTSEQQQQRTPPPPARSLRRRTTRTSARAGLQAPTETVIPLTESAQGSPVPTEIVASPVPTEIVASPVPTEPVTEPSRRADQAAASQNAPEVDVPRASRSESDHDDPDEMDNFSDASSVTHNISESSRGSSPQPVTNDATLKYVVDIIKANTEKDEQLRDEIEQLQERAIKAKKLLQEQYYLLNAEREHRDRIMTFLIYHIRNNNRWIGQFANADKLPPAVFEQMVSNGGRGWRDMGEWEYGEVWSGPMVVSESNIEITGSNLEEYLRDMWDIHQRQRMEEKAAENESSADKPTSSTAAPDVPPSGPVSSSRKRKSSCPPSSEHEARPTSKRLRLSPIREGSLPAPDPSSSSSPPINRRNKGKGRMTSVEVEQQARADRARSMRELDEDDSAEAYEIQVALADSLLRSASKTAMDQ